MNIAILTEKFPPDFGGLAVSAGRLAGGLASRGHAVSVFHLTNSVPPGKVERDHIEGVILHRIGAFPRTDDSLAAWFDEIIRAHAVRSFELIHGFYLVQAGFTAVLAGQFLNRPAVISARGNDLDRAVFDPGKAAHILFALRSAAAVTANTRELARKALSLGAVGRITVIPNGVDAALFCPGQPDPDLAQRLKITSIPARPLMVGFTGEARAKKGLDTLLAAIEILASGTNPGSSPHLLMVGGARKGTDRELLENFQAAHPELVTVVPPQPLSAMPAFYRLMDVLALPSRHDGLPNSLLEGMACGLAIAAAPVGGMLDVLRHNENALLVPPEDPHALAAALRLFLEDAALRRKLGGQARLDMIEQLGLEQELIGYETLFQQLQAASS